MARSETRWEIGDVLDRTDLARLLDELATPATRHGGGQWHCPMPDHDDRHPSVTMHRDHRGHERWRCWSADHCGDAIDLVASVTGRTPADAIDWLATRAGMTPDRPLPPVPPKQRPARSERARRMDPAVDQYVHACARIINSGGGRQVREWLHARGISDATIRANLVGADPGRTLMHRQRGLPYGAAVAATFPVFDPAGNLTYVQARYLDPDTVGRKYDNPSATLAPHPRLGFAVAPRRPRNETLLVCEGTPDALIAAQAGFQAVALLGANLPDEAVGARLANHATNHATGIAIVGDADPPGRRAADALTALLAAHDIDPIVITPPDGHDLNDWALATPLWARDLAEQLTGHEPDLDRGVGIDL